MDAAFLALGRCKGKGSSILGVNSQCEVVLGGTYQPGLCMTQPFIAIWLLRMSPCHGVK